MTTCEIHDGQACYRDGDRWTCPACEIMEMKDSMARVVVELRGELAGLKRNARCTDGALRVSRPDAEAGAP